MDIETGEDRKKRHPIDGSMSRVGKVAVAWVPTREISQDEWIAIGRRLGGISRCNQWWLGDWLRYGAGRWGERYVRAAKITGYDPRTLANVASIAAVFKASRRRDNLTWSHHAAVSALPELEQEEWLDRAASHRLSVADLRIELRAAKKGEGTENAEEESSHQIVFCPHCGHRLSDEDLKKKAARQNRHRDRRKHIGTHA
jgi:hypothetical protein